MEGDLALADLGQGLPLRPGSTFDGAISISALQWLCNADKAGHEPRKRLKRFFDSLYGSLARGARAVLQVRWGLAACCAADSGHLGLGWLERRRQAGLRGRRAAGRLRGMHELSHTYFHLSVAHRCILRTQCRLR